MSHTSEVSHGSDSDSLFKTRVRKFSGGLFWLGLAMVALGIAAIAFPVFSTLVAAVFVGWLMLIFGVATFFSSFSLQGTGPFFGAFLLGLLSIAAGGYLLFNPQAGAVALTLLAGVMFAFQGLMEIFIAFEMRPLSGWVGMLISGIASLILAVLLAIGWPAISTIALGILFGVDFLTSGIAYMYASSAVKSGA